VSHPHFTQTPPRHSHSLRLTFAYTGSQVRLARVERVAMLAPAAVAPPPEGPQAGYWIEVRDAAERLLYHRPLQDPLRADVEVFGDEPGEPIYRVANKKREGEFEVLVPDFPEATHFSVHGPPPKARTVRGPSKELVRHEFSELRRLDADSAREDDQ